MSPLFILPCSCPECGSHAVSWSPKRVWCTMCSFQTAVRSGEKATHAITRWNRAIQDGIGYIALVQENHERQERIRLAKLGNPILNPLHA